MTNVRWYLYRIIIAMLKLLDIGIAQWNEDEKIFAQLQMLHHCIITTLQMAADWTELSLSFIENKRTPRSERYCKTRWNSPERENNNVRIIHQGHAIIGNSIRRQKKVCIKFTNLHGPICPALGKTDPHYSSWWPPRLGQFRDATHFKRRPESANENTVCEPLANEKPGMVSGALLTAGLCIT